ncbi:MAG: ATP-binding protein [Candidatus Margulisiibacteriota bacterium]
MENNNTTSSILITFDKSHLVTIGEKLYTESIELIRELVNNAFDADATEVKVNISDDSIVVDDNGCGMDEEGLKQYFSIGSTEKRKHNRSPRFGRIRIGEFGIGKFASLSACGHFEVTTKKDDFAATVVFDKEEWEKNESHWRLPMRIEKTGIKGENGTTVILTKLFKKFDPEDIERRILEGVPIKAEHFSVHLNGKKLAARFIAGQRIPIFEGTEFGVISGELIIVPNASLLAAGPGIEIKVKGVTIKRELFGLEAEHPELLLLSGEAHADFLPITSDRTGFILDSPEYLSFSAVMKRVMERILSDIRKWQNKKQRRKIRRIANDAIDRVKAALKKNPELASLMGIPVDEDKEKEAENKEAEKSGKPRKKRKTEAQKRMTAKNLNPSSVITKLKIGKKGFSCLFDNFGPDAPEAFTEGSIIYVNEDHSLYKRESKNRERQVVHIARLLTQELSMLKNPKNARQAYEIQSKLLKDALIE